jgi:hypothetical protein
MVAVGRRTSRPGAAAGVRLEMLWVNTPITF